MNTTERLYVWLNNGTFVEKNGCTHPQDIIAASIGCSERTVIRCVQQLEAEGRLRVHRPRRRGACNTYYVACWNPARRSGVLNVIAAVKPDVLKRRREREERLCQIKRTATASRAQTPPSAPSPRCKSLVNQRCGRERFEIRRSTVDQRRRPQHITVVPDLTCPRCQELAQEVERVREEANHVRELLRKQAEQQTGLMEEVAGAMETSRATGRENARLRRQITRQAKESAKAEQVEAVIAHWKKHRPKTKASSFPPGGKNWQTIEKALSLMVEDEDGPVQACREAIDGLHIAPFEAYGRRYMKDGPNRTLRNRLEHALGDETRIERCRGIVRRVREDGADRAWELAQVAEATYWALTELTQERIRERRRGPVVDEPARFTVDGLRVRSDGR